MNAKKDSNGYFAAMILVPLCILILAYAVEVLTDDEPAVVAVAQPKVDKSPEMQAQRRAFIDKLIQQRVFSQVKVNGNVPYVYVTPSFLQGDIQDKEKIISVVYSFYYNGSNDLDFVRLLDSKTGKTIGSYSMVQGGLKMD